MQSSLTKGPGVAAESYATIAPSIATASGFAALSANGLPPVGALIQFKEGLPSPI